TRVSRASTIRPERFSISPWPMKHSFASIPGPCGTAGRPDRRALVRLVGTLLAPEIGRRIAPAAHHAIGRAAAIRWFLRPETLHRSPRLNQRTIDREVLARQQSLDPRLG